MGVNGAGQQQKVKSIPLDPLEILRWQNVWVSSESLDKQHQHHLEEVILEMQIFTLDKHSETVGMESSNWSLTCLPGYLMWTQVWDGTNGTNG